VTNGTLASGDPASFLVTPLAFVTDLYRFPKPLPDVADILVTSKGVSFSPNDVRFIKEADLNKS